MHLENIVKNTLEIKYHKIVSVERDTENMTITFEPKNGNATRKMTTSATRKLPTLGL